MNFYIVDGSVFRSVTGQRSSTSFTECEQKRLRTNECAIDRGGLFHINDSAYHLFRAIEEKTRQILPRHLALNSRDALLEEIKESEDVLFYWSMLSIDIHSPEDADELLKSVIQLWVTIRGYSLSATWFEEYKKAHHSSSKKRALRKDLHLQQAD